VHTSSATVCIIADVGMTFENFSFILLQDRFLRVNIVTIANNYRLFLSCAVKCFCKVSVFDTVPFNLYEHVLVGG